MIDYFACCIETQEDSEGIAELLQTLAHELRTDPPLDTSKPQHSPASKAAWATYRLADQARQEGRPDDENGQGDG